MSYTMLANPAWERLYFGALKNGVDVVDIEVVAEPKRCFLLELPDELKFEIVEHIEQRKDLYHLSLSCRVLEDVVMKKLYKTVDIEIPQSKTMSWNLGRLPSFRPQVLKFMQELAIRNGIMDVRDPVYHKRRKSDAGTVDGYICDLIEQAPDNRLRSFEFMHQSPVSLRLLEAIALKQGRCLEKLSFFEAEDSQPIQRSLPTNLRTLECRSIHSGEAVIQLVKASQKTLERLSLGQEKALVEQYRRNRVGYLERIPQPMESLTQNLDVNSITNLRSLSLMGLNLETLIPASIESASWFLDLTSLTLQSCLNTAPFLDAISATFTNARQASLSTTQKSPQLKQFVFRHETVTNHLKDCVLTFLTSFAGLECLSLLFENCTLTERPSTLIASHGPTLLSLTLESRIQPREHLGLDTSRPFGNGAYTHQLWQESINDICTLCPNLTELSMGFPWDDEMVRLRRTKLPELKYLKTIHIRNFPESQVLSQLGDYAVKEYATKFVEWCFPSLVGGSRPSLETLAIGPTLYETRWKCGVSCVNPTTSSSPARRNVTPTFTHPGMAAVPQPAVVPADTDQLLANSGTTYRRYHNPPEYLRTHYYCLDWAKTRFGRWSPLITGVSERCLEELRGEKPLGGVFEGVWLK